MPEITEYNVVGLIRERTEEEGLKQYLKSTIGGYTKKSVMEFLTLLRKQQQEAAETFNNNMQALLEEKESLKTDNEKLQLKLTQIESDYQSLTDTLIVHDLENTEFSIQDILTLKSNLSVLDAENKKQQNVAREYEKKIERLISEITEKDTELKKSKQETKTQKELLSAEKQETNKQRTIVSKLSETAEDLRDEIKFLKEMNSEGKISKLNYEIKELIANAELQDELILRSIQELAVKEKNITILTEENNAIRQSMVHLSKTLEDLNAQNEKLTITNNELSLILEAEQKKITKLINEKAEETVEKLKLSRKLEELNLNVSMIELNSRKYVRTECVNEKTDFKEKAAI